ncbi:MAG: SAM-dependent methyltransferase [Candidatus Binatia bacterium]
MTAPEAPRSTDVHRDRVGGLWDDIGRLQIDFLRAQGLAPGQTLLDVGCGCLRGGVHFVPFLDHGNYYGLDIDADLLRAGVDVELPRAGLAGRVPADHLLVNDAFEAWRFGVVFDVAWAHSLFTHLPAAEVRRCLVEVSRCVRPGGRFFATFFAAGEDVARPVTHQPGGIVTRPDQDPYHYRFRDLAALCDGLPWRPVDVGDWHQPRAQHMARFDRE